MSEHLGKDNSLYIERVLAQLLAGVCTQQVIGIIYAPIHLIKSMSFEARQS